MVVSVLPGGETRVLPYFVRGALQDVMQIETATLSLAQLETDQAVAEKLAVSVGIPVATGTIRQHVELYTPDSKELESRLQEAGLELPESVVIVESSLPVEAANYLAGFALSPIDCTSGFIGFKSSTNEGGVFTAGHCGGSGAGSFSFAHASGTLAFDVDYNSGSRDWQFNENTTTNSLRSMVNIGATWLPITGLKWRSQQVEGSLICKFGKYTGYDCGTIADREYDWGAGFNPTFIRAEKPNTQLIFGGDSGGPWFAIEGNPPKAKAAGITKGYDNQDGIYMAIDYIYPSHGIYTNCQPDNYC